MDILLNVVTILFILLLLIKFNENNKRHIVENKLFNNLIILTLMGNIITLVYNCNISVRVICLKFFCVFHVTWALIYFVYLLSICKRNKYLTNGSKYDSYINKIVNIGSLLVIIFSVFIFLGELNYYDGIGYKGNSLNYSYFVSLTIILISILFLIFNNKYLSKKNYMVLLVILLLSAFSIIMPYYIGMYNNIYVFIEVFVLYLLYLSIANPDLVIINDLTLAKEQAERSNKNKTEFLTSMSHQIRTPVNTIDGLCQLIEEDKDMENIKENVKDIRVASKNLVDLVNGILDISLLESGNIKIINQNYETYEVFDSVLELAKSMVINKNVKVKGDISDNIPSVLLGDSERIKQVLLNLLSNAIKFTKEGTVELKVTSTVSGNLCRLKMSVKDTGSGISKENLHKIFSKFEKLDNNTVSEGNGLGLVITQNIVELMEGKLDVESEYGLGSVFTVTIDQKIISPITREEQLMSKSNKQVKSFDATGKKILLVDDNRLNLKVASKMLASYNIEVTECSSGREFLDIIDKNKNFDLILLDDMMPNMSGVEALDIFKKQERVEGFSIPVVVLTANAVTGMKEDYLARGFDDYLAKPIEKPELNRILKKFLK